MKLRAWAEDGSIAASVKKATLHTDTRFEDRFVKVERVRYGYFLMVILDSLPPLEMVLGAVHYREDDEISLGALGVIAAILLPGVTMMGGLARGASLRDACYDEDHEAAQHGGTDIVGTAALACGKRIRGRTVRIREDGRGGIRDRLLDTHRQVACPPWGIEHSQCFG